MYLHRFINYSRPKVDAHRGALAGYMLELSLLDYEGYISLPAHHVAAAAFCYSNLMFNVEAWPTQMAVHFGINLVSD